MTLHNYEHVELDIYVKVKNLDNFPNLNITKKHFISEHKTIDHNLMYIKILNKKLVFKNKYIFIKIKRVKITFCLQINS